MGEINFFPDDIEIKDQKIILRLDLNVPIQDKIIKDYTRISLCLPFMNKLIERKAKRTTKGYLKGRISVTTNFWTYDENDQEISLNGEQRRDTNKGIRSYLGNYEDFILTSISVQNNNTGFIDLSQSQRKDLLAQFLDVTVFEELYDLAIQDIKEEQPNNY